MDYEKKYKEALEKAKRALYCDSKGYVKTDKELILSLFPELKESEDERIRKGLIKYFKNFNSESLYTVGLNEGEIISWLEKQGDNNEIAKDILRGAAIHLITWIDYNATEGNMCLSNMECKDIEDALVSGDWNKIYAYMKKKLEKQGEQKPTDKQQADDLIDMVTEKPTEWSEEDEERLQSCLNILQAKGVMGVTETINTKWLKSLKQRIGG